MRRLIRQCNEPQKELVELPILMVCREISIQTADGKPIEIKFYLRVLTNTREHTTRLPLGPGPEPCHLRGLTAPAPKGSQ